MQLWLSCVNVIDLPVLAIIPHFTCSFKLCKKIQIVVVLSVFY